MHPFVWRFRPCRDTLTSSAGVQAVPPQQRQKRRQDRSKAARNGQAVLQLTRRAAGLALALGLILTGAPMPAQESGRGPVTGFPIPRYVSIQASEAFARRGPSRSHRIDWVFQRRNMPVQVVAEHGHWRRVVDRDGAGGWMHYSLLSGVRTAIIELDMLELRQRPDPDAPVVAQAELGVIAFLDACDGAWCRLNVGGHRGWVPMETLWGVDPGEVFD